MHGQSCCFANINLLLFALLTAPSSLLKLGIFVIQKFCYHGNVMSGFSSLLFFPSRSFPFVFTNFFVKNLWRKFGFKSHIRSLINKFPSLYRGMEGEGAL